MIDRSKLLDTIENGAYWGAGVTFQRSNAVPLEKYSIFESLEKAQEYALTNPVAYPGQIVAVVPEEGKSVAYIIMGDGSLEAVGSETMTRATAEQDGTGGAVPAPKAGEDANFLRGDGTWDKVDAGEVWVNNETLLNFIPIILTQAEYDTLIDGGTITLNGQELSFEEHRIYMIKRSVTAKEG